MPRWWSEQVPCSSQGSAAGSHKQEVAPVRGMRMPWAQDGSPALSWQAAGGTRGSSHSSDAN